MMKTGRCIPLGKIIKPHGIHGELKVFPYTQHPQNLKRYKWIRLSLDKGKTLQVFTSKRVRIHGTQVIMSLAECTDRDTAETLAGLEIWIRAEELPTLNDGEYYLFELEGKRAVNTAGLDLGEIVSVLSSQGQNLLLVVKGNRDYLVPLVSEFIVFRGPGQVVLDLPPGLLEIND
ncbi:MAG: 16S rRNA processing protein RimM [Desulfobulbus propionicus]|nr:MAG: 16S rRNA processing protein RimM [Desulfobulbus propionicus]